MSTWKELKDNPRLNQIYRDRAEIIRAVREFFWCSGFLETDTPTAVKYPGQEPYLNPIPLVIHDTAGRGESFHLITSPEFSLKKLLAAGFAKIFSITKCFRDYESFGGNHNTEFTMIEWYRAPGTLEHIMDDTEELFKSVGKKLQISDLKLKESKIKLNQKWERKTMKSVWQKYVGVNLDDYLQIENLKKLVVERGFSVAANDEFEDLFFKIFLNLIEPKLGFDAPVFIYDYPAQMTSLSRLCDHDSRYAERFELYIAGLEIANAFGELLDASEQKRRLEADKALRAKLDKETWPIDEDFIEALPAIADRIKVAGLPVEAAIAAKAGGIALGIDRMVVLFTGAKDINEVIFQSISDQIWP